MLGQIYFKMFFCSLSVLHFRNILFLILLIHCANLISYYKKKKKSMEGQSIRLVFPSLQWILLAAFETAQPLQLENYPSPKTLKSASSKPQQQNIRGLVSSLATARAAPNHISLQFTFIRSGLDTGASTRQRHRTVPHGKVRNYLF